MSRVKNANELGYNSATDSTSEWPDPQPIRHELRPVEPLKSEIIPEPYRGWIGDVAHRMQCPIDFVAAAAIVMTSSIIGAGCGIKPKKHDDWLVVPNLWGGAIGRPSMLKTPALAEAFRPLARLEAIAKEEYDAAMQNYLIEAALHKAEQNRCPTQIPAQWSGVPIAILGPNEARLTKEKIVRDIKHRSEVRMCNRASRLS